MATNFGLANLYNVFVLGNMNMSNTDAEGRVAAGGNVTLSNYGVGAGISPLPPAGTDASLVIDGSVNISGGSNASGNTVVNPASTITAYTMGNPNGSLTTGTPIDFSEAGRYLKCASAWWGALAPFAAANNTYSQINGNIIFDSYSGNAESHNELFTGALPEPTACLLTTTSSSTSSTSSTTSSTSSTTSSTSSTTSSSTTTANPSLRRQAITDLFESVALQQTALSHILNAEGEKLQRIFAFDNITPETVLAANHSVESTVNAIAGLESVLEMKLRLFTDCACNPPRN